MFTAKRSRRPCTQPVARSTCSTPSGSLITRAVAGSAPSAPPASPTAAVVTLTEAGTIQWGADFVSLREFLDRLQTLRARSPHVEPKITFRATSAAAAGAVRYVMEEARRAEVGVLVITDGPMSANKDGGWF